MKPEIHLIVIEQLAKRVAQLETELASAEFWRIEAETERDELKTKLANTMLGARTSDE